LEQLQGFHFLFEATDVLTKTTNLAKGYFYLQTENTTDSNSISTDDMDRQSVTYESPAIVTTTKIKVSNLE
jgi:hypothetical protein